MEKIKKDIILCLVTIVVSICLLILGVKIGLRMNSSAHNLVINGVTYEYYQSQIDTTGEFVVSLFVKK